MPGYAEVFVVSLQCILQGLVMRELKLIGLVTYLSLGTTLGDVLVSDFDPGLQQVLDELLVGYAEQEGDLVGN